MIKFRELIQRAKVFINENPQRKKLFLTLFVLAIIPITVIAALTVQNLTQHAGGGSYITISGQDGSILTATDNPNVFIDINLDTSTSFPKWVLPNQPSAFNINNNLIGKAYAIEALGGGSTPTPMPSCIQKGDANGDGTINMGDVVRVERIILGRDPATDGADANGDGSVNMGDVTKIERYILGQDTPPACNPTPTSIPVSTSPTPIPSTPTPTSSLTSTPTNEPTPTPTSAPSILRAIYIENKDTDGSTGGSAPIRITINTAADIVRIPWRLNDLLQGQTQAPRIVQVTFIGDNLAVPFATTINLTKSSDASQTMADINLSLFHCPSTFRIGYECEMSALAYDSEKNPIFKGITYSWGISSVNSIGMIDKTEGNITKFYAKNLGTGSIWVIAKQGDTQVQKSINIQVIANDQNPTPASGNGTISGNTVPSGATLVVKNAAGVIVKTTTTPIDHFSLPVGRYSFIFNKSCYKEYRADDVPIVSGDNGMGTWPLAPISPQPPECFGIYNLSKDGVVDCKDMKILIGQYGKKGTNLSADLSRDGIVDGIDYNIMLRNYTPGNTTVCQ